MSRRKPGTHRLATMAMLVPVLLVVALFATACSSFSLSSDPVVRDPAVRPNPDDPAPGDPESSAPESSEDEAAEAEPTPPSISTVPRVEDQEATARIAVQTDEGQIFTIVADGSDRIDLTDPAEGRFNRQPTWSPDSSRVGWVAFNPVDASAQIRTDRFDLSSPTMLDVPSPPFYLNWDPSSSQIAYLAPSVAGIDLGLAQVRPGSSAPASDDEAADAVQRLDRGEPYFFSWGPDGDELLVHASDFRLDRIDVDGSTRVIEEFPAPFHAPVWLGEEQTLVYADERDGEAFLITSGPLGEGRLELATFEGELTFIVNDPGEYAAVISRDLPPEDGGVITAGFQPDPLDPSPFDENDPFADPVDVLPRDTLGFIALYGGELTTLSNGQVVAFFWDPTGETLAWLEPSDTDPGLLRWWFSDRNDVWPGVSFRPSQTMISNYLPFFDQYAQSHTFFSPDGSQLTFAGELANGEAGIFVVDTAPSATARKVADGVFSVWSPNAAGGGASVL